MEQSHLHGPFVPGVYAAPMSKSRLPAVVLGGLNLLRPLGWAGIPVVIATPEPDDAPALASRYCSEAFVMPPFANRDAAIDALIGLGRRIRTDFGENAPLYFGSDESLTLVQEGREALAPFFRFVLNEPDTARALLDKTLFQELAVRLGLPVPRVLEWESVAEAGHPVLIKPKSKVGWGVGPMSERLLGPQGKARVFENGAEAASHPAVRQFKDELLFQEYLPGDDRHLWSFHGFATETGEILASFVGRKLRTFPALTGMSTYLELAHDDNAERAGRDAAAKLGLKGFFKIDFKQDARTGRMRVLEVNARSNLWHHLAAKNGLNMPLIAYEYMVSRARPASTSYETTYRWLNFDLDRHAYRDLAARGDLTLAGWLTSLVRGPKVYDLFAWNDPWPFMLDVPKRLRSLSRFAARRLKWQPTAS